MNGPFRKRPWPSCPNPETGNEWSQDMKENIISVLKNTTFDVVYAPKDIQVVDDPSLRQVLSKYFKGAVAPWVCRVLSYLVRHLTHGKILTTFWIQ